MKHGIFFILSYRAGSSVFLTMLGDDGHNSFRMPTAPITKCHYLHSVDCINHYTTKIQTNQNLLSSFIISNHAHLGEYNDTIGFWKRFGNEISYDWSPQRLKEYCNSWKIVVLIRDGRNQIESWRESDKHKSESFEEMCVGYNNRVSHINHMSENFDTHIIKFEDLIKNTSGVVENMYNFLNLKITEEHIKYCNSVIKKDHFGHSSFGSLDDINNRWKSWSKQELSTFKNISGKYFRMMNYEW
jgi:hypothetical protein